MVFREDGYKIKDISNIMFNLVVEYDFVIALLEKLDFGISASFNTG